MRFCPFCAKKTGDEQGRCEHCGKKLPMRRGSEASFVAEPTLLPPPMPMLGMLDRAARGEAPRPRPRGMAFDPETDPGDTSVDRTRPESPIALRPHDGDGQLTDPGTDPAGGDRPRRGFPIEITTRRDEIDASATVPMPLLDPSELGDLYGPAPGDRTVRVVLEDAVGFESDGVPEPLPPPPQSELDLPSVSVDESQLAPPRRTPLPIDPALLPPLPKPPAAPGLLGVIRYLPPLARAILARREAEAKLKRAVEREQQALDRLLRDLGRSAAEQQLDHPAIRQEMAALQRFEAERRDAAPTERPPGGEATGERTASAVELSAARERATQAITRKHATIGRLLNLNRVEGPRLSPLYDRIDDLKGDLTEMEALIARLDDERHSYDVATLQTGIVAAIGLSLLLAVAVALLIAFA